MAEATPERPKGFTRVANIFMIVAFAFGLFYIISFVRLYPKFWFAAVLFVIIAVFGIIRRIAVLRGRLPQNYAPDPNDPDNPAKRTDA
jgi:hypothetical protein